MNFKKVLLPILIFKIFTFQILFAYPPFIEDLIVKIKEKPRNHIGRGATKIFLKSIKNGSVMAANIFLTQIKQKNVLTPKRKEAFFEGIKKNNLIWNILYYYSKNDFFAKKLLQEFEQTHPNLTNKIKHKNNRLTLLCAVIEEKLDNSIIQTIKYLSKKKPLKLNSSLRFAIARSKEIIKKYPDIFRNKLGKN